MRISDWSSDVCSSDLFGPPSQTPLMPQAAAASTLERPIPHLQLRSAVSMWCRFPAKTSPFSIASELHFLQLASSFLQLRRESLNCTRSGPFRHPLLKLAGRLFGLAPFLLLQGIASSVSIIIYSKRRDRNGRNGLLADAGSDVGKLQVANERPDDAGRGLAKIGRAPSRERVGQCGESTGVAGALK